MTLQAMKPEIYLLQQVATRLLECVEANHMVARLGSDEFVVLLDHLGSSEMEAIPQLEKDRKIYFTDTH